MDLENSTNLISLFDSIEDAVIAFDKQLRYAYVNKRALEILKKKKEDIIGEKIDDVFPQLRHSHLGKKFFQVVKSGKSATWEYYSPGGKIWLKVHAYPNTYGYILFYTDITEKHALEESLEEKAKLLDLSYDAIFMQDEENKILYWNKGAERVYGWKKEEAVGKKGYKILGTQFSEGYDKFFKDLLKSKHWKGILQHKTKHGKKILVESTWSYIEHNGNIKILEINRDITEAESAKRLVILNEQKFKSLIENSSDVILVTNKEGKISFVSQSVKKIFGYMPKDVINMSTLQYFHPDDLPKTMRNLHKLLTGQASHTSGQYRIKNKKGEWRWIDVQATSLLNDPSVNGIVSNFRDITDEKMYQSEIENKNKKITEILENFNYAYYAIDKNWVYTYVNKEGEKLAGKKREAMLGKTVQDIFPDAVNAESHKAIRRALKTGKPQEYDLYFEPFEKWYHNYVAPTNEGVDLYAYDITATKNIEQQIHDTQQELEAILKNIPNGVMVQDSSGDLIYANREAVRLSGYNSTEEMMQAPRFDYLFKFDLRDEYGKKFPIENLPGRVALKTGKNAQATIKFINRDSGEGHWLTISSTVIYRGHERKPLVVNVMQDITDFKEADVRKNDFISMASHELKTPLTSLKVYMHLLIEGKNINDSKKTEYLTKASHQIDTLQELVSELLDQSTIQQGKLLLHQKEVYLDFFIREFVNNFQETTKDFSFILEGKTESIVMIDRYRIEQVLANLLSNAVKYSKDTKKIVVTLSKTAKMVSVSVKDSGVGIASSELPNIFKPYYRVIGKKENTYPGMGMGLYIARDIIVKHGGELTVESSVGKGTTLTFTLPIA